MKAWGDPALEGSAPAPPPAMPKGCDCAAWVRCAECGDVSADRIAEHLNAGHRVDPYGCEECQPSLRGLSNE